MSEWKEFKLEDITEKFIDYRGKTPPKTESGIALITAKIVKNGKILTPTEFIDETTYKKWTTRGFPEINDVVLTTEAPLGEVALLKDKNVALAQRIILIRGKKDICHNPFLKYYLQSKDGQYELESRASGTTVFGIKASVLKEIPISLPPYPEQKAIAAVLSSLDDKIDLLHRQNKTLEALAETLFRQWFVEEAQDDWEKVDLEYVTEKITDGAHQSPPTVEIGMPMASVKDMHQWGINYSTCRNITENDFQKLVRDDCRPLKNDILIAKDGSYLKHVFVAQKDMDVVLLSSIAILRPNGKYHPFLLSVLLKLDTTIAEMENIVTGAVIPRIVLKDFKKFPILLPPLSIQQKALEIIEPIVKKCYKNITQIKCLEKMRDTLLPKLMSGEVRIK